LIMIIILIIIINKGLSRNFKFYFGDEFI